jgi:hypothetical protein
MTSARRAARSAHPTQFAKLLHLRRCKLLPNGLRPRFPLG